MRCLTVLLNETAAAANAACVRPRQRQRHSSCPRQPTGQHLWQQWRPGAVCLACRSEQPEGWPACTRQRTCLWQVESRCLASRQTANWDFVVSVVVADGCFLSAYFTQSCNAYCDSRLCAAATVRWTVKCLHCMTTERCTSWPEEFNCHLRISCRTHCWFIFFVFEH